MGVVYKARHPTLDMVVALKTISASLDETPEIRQRFHVEARSAAQLSHENIIRIYDYDEYKGKAYLVLEFLEGSDLKAEIQKIKEQQRPPLPLGQSLQIMLGVCKGLSHAHEKGIYHRDIKPANIFLTNSGQVKILDFGLAKMVSDQVTLTGAQMGTVAYMSPEQIDGKPIDQRSDIFSTGVLFYELLTYSQPFTGESWSEILFKIINTDPKPIESINKLIPPELSAIVTRAMAKDRAKRFQRMREFLESLEHFGRELEVRKRELQSEAKEAIGKLEKLIEENKDLLQERAAQLQEVKQDPPTILLKLGVAGSAGEPERHAGFTLDYWEIAEICERAKQEYKELNSIVRKREHFDVLLSKAETLIRKGDLVKALETVESILDDAPSHQQALAIKAQISTRIRETRSDAKKQERAEEFLKLAESSFAVNDFTGCIAFSAEVLKLVPNHKQAILLLERAQQGIKERAQREEIRRTAEKELADARDALVARKYEQARAAAGKALDLCPDLREASDLLSEINEAEQRYREDAARQRRIADLLLEARGSQESGKLGVALDRIKEILAIEPDHRSAIAFKDKVEELLRAQQRSDELFTMAAEKYAEDDLTECFPLLTEALKLRPGHPSALALLEHTKQKIKERAERQEKRRQAMAALEHSRALLTRGELQSALHEVEAIKTEFPDTPGLSVLLDEIQRAREELRIKNELEQKVGELLHTATSHIQSGQEDLALEVLNQIQSTAPDNPKAAALAREINEKRQARERELRERRERISQLFGQAQEAERSQDLKKAGELAETILAQEITHSGARDLIARVEAEIIRRQRQEEEQRQKIAELLKTVSEAESAGQLEKAIHAMDGILAIDSRRKDIVELRRKMQAQLESERARKARQAEAEQQKQIGLQLLERARFREGLASLQNAKKILTDDREILASIAQAEEGIRAEELLLKIQSGIANARKALAQENHAEATERVNEVLLLDR
jgi:serine/threonine protein kinase